MTTDKLMSELLETCPDAERIRMGKTRGTSDLRAIIDAIREDNSRAASNTTAGDEATICANCNKAKGSHWRDKDYKAFCSPHDLGNAKLFGAAVSNVEFQPASDSGRGDSGVVTYQLGYDNRNLEQGELYRSGELIGTTFDPSDAEQIAAKLSGWEAMQAAINLFAYVRDSGRADLDTDEVGVLETAIAALADPQP